MWLWNRISGLFAVFLLALPPVAEAEEGMWPFDSLPVEELRTTYGFSPSPAWLDHVRLSCVRFMDGGSGSFVSPRGLLATNHHVAVGQLQKLSTAEHDYVADGFYARTLAEELPCPDLEVNVLVHMENVTATVLSVVKDGMSEEEGLKARKAERARIEKESMEATGLRSDVISLYRGGEYWLYRYRKYTDVRMVMAPERQAAYFGGDWDNFTYPRFDLDVTFLRVYEDGKPLRNAHFLNWSPTGPGKDDVVFVAGHPGSTRRLNTVVQLEYLRDRLYPARLALIDKTIEALEAYAAQGPEKRRRALYWLFGYGNAKKCLEGEHRGLKSPALMARRRKQERELRTRVEADPELKRRYASAWERIERTYDEHADENLSHYYQGLGRGTLASTAVTVVKYVQEVEKPDAERLDGFHDSELEEVRFHLFSRAPIYRDLEAVFMEVGFRFCVANLGTDHPFARILLGLGDLKAAAGKLTAETKLADVAYRKKLLEGGLAAVKASDDPLIALARRVVPRLRENERWCNKNWESVETAAGEQIARSRFAVFGKTVYPDATFSLRLTFGPVKGYPMNGTKAPYKTTLYGLFDRALSFDRQQDFELPARFWHRKDRLELSTPVNFVCELDITGGNSGSPVINRRGELVGLIFDGNIEGLSNEFSYDPVHSRAVAVHSAYVLEALRTLYDAGRLADEIQGADPRPLSSGSADG